MPVLKSDYQAPAYLFSKHLQTILPALFRTIKGVSYQRTRITTPDNDFLDLDWSTRDNTRLAIISHGLEGSSQANYARGMVKAFNHHQWDALCWNFRGCSGEINRQYRFYHSGETKDLDCVIQHVVSKNRYQEIVLIGFSIGGNITLKFLGEQKDQLHSLIKSAVVFSVPCHLASGAQHLERFENKVYMNRFLKSLHKKIKAKSAIMPERINDNDFYRIKNFYDFDERYTAPIHGFRNAHDYWEKNSSLYFIKDINISTLIINAKNDPFLTPECFPVKEAKNNSCVFLEVPDTGGHCGFYSKSIDGIYWSEKRALEFISNYA